MLLREKDKKSLIAIFETANVPFEVWAYGSRVNGSAHDGSDLDLVIRSQSLNKLPANIYIDLCEKIRDSNIPILVELRDWAMLPESFHKNIEKQYEVLYSNLSTDTLLFNNTLVIL
jgi:predicted nucleotidyltransferase